MPGWLRVLAVASTASALAVLAGSSPARAHYERCTVMDQEDSCLTGEQCSASDGDAGICLPPPCTTNVDCRKPTLPLCDTRSTPAVCIGCFNDSDCVAPRTCELDPRSPASNRCVDCKLGQVGACETSDAGTHCVVEKGVCGCSTNADCPAAHFCRRVTCIPRPPINTGLPPDAGTAGTEEGGTASASLHDESLSGRGGGCAIGAVGVMGVWNLTTTAAYVVSSLLVVALRRRRRATEVYTSASRR